MNFSHHTTCPLVLYMSEDSARPRPSQFPESMVILSKALAGTGVMRPSGMDLNERG